jgi:hypothetical protein
MLRIFCTAILCCASATAILAAPRIRTIPLPGAGIAGFAVDGETLFTWGEDVYRIDLRSGKRERIAEGRFAEGGCVLDSGLILNSVSPPELIWLRLADGKRFVVDTGVDTRDVIPADLLGHHGVLLIHKRQQVRFYDVASPMHDGWPATELYTIYTPSTEGGLVIADIDGDGLPDLLCGNYWMKSPTAFELPWREFAIDTWNEAEGSAMLRLAWSEPVRVAAQRDMRPARVAWFERPTDPKQLWTAHNLASLQGVASLKLINKGLFILELDPPGRVLRFRRQGAGFGPGKELIRTNRGVGLASLPGNRLLILEKFRISLLTLANFN